MIISTLIYYNNKYIKYTINRVLEYVLNAISLVYQLKEMKANKTYIPSNNSDEYNPMFLFSTIPSELLRAIVNGEIDAKELAKKELDKRF